MYKLLLYFCCLIVVILFILSAGQLFLTYIENNFIVITSHNYVNILENVHDNIDKYINKNVIVTGYVYIKEDFNEKSFVIAQDVFLGDFPPAIPYIVGFLCSNSTNKHLLPNETISIIGKITPGVYNDMEYPVLQVKHIIKYKN